MRVHAMFSTVVLLTQTLTVSAQKTDTQSLKSGDDISVVITVPDDLGRFNRSSKTRKKRFQFRGDTASITLNMAQSSKLIVKKSKLNGINSEKQLQRVVMKRDDIRLHAQHEQDSVWKAMTSFYEKAELPSKDQYMDAVRRFITGKNGGNRMASQWHTVGISKINSAVAVNGTVKVGMFKKFTFVTDTLPGADRYLLPAFDEGQCKPLDRFYERKKLHGYGIDKFRYQPYVPNSRKILRKNFEVYFEKNKADVRPGDLMEIRQFLAQNNLTILNATIEGFSSLEGSLERNRELQKLRAGWLLRELQKHNNERQIQRF